jgi:hypothetical protein
MQLQQNHQCSKHHNLTVLFIVGLALNSIRRRQWLSSRLILICNSFRAPVAKPAAKPSKPTDDEESDFDASDLGVSLYSR